MRIAKTTAAFAATTLLALGALSAATPASAAALKVGTLGCHSDGSIGYVVGSQDKLVCEFTPIGSGDTALYAGTLDTTGLSVGATGRTVMTWAVVSLDGSAAQPGSLAGTYVGASANASAFVGGGVNALVGGSNDSLSLQPLSLTGQEGINATLGVAKLQLLPAAPVLAGEPVVPIAVAPAGGNAVVPR
ncbi:DUF992 domain-containing protein [Fulvimarina endophytica]|uniref:DUF992 domain-containing protein n=1 Tax=Fulvimarina endophytica TaxID=2293836 RepID=A0A371X263_9HYPH|nr:DUF992 domain-containing protein [Fulvimarina endophytica]RFC63312.1 DUF992 domain-containing protein [Fulvimarina endophytica]